MSVIENQRIEKMIRVKADGKHNAFTSMALFKGTLYLTCRTSSGHAFTDGRITLMRSFDMGETWETLNSPFTENNNYYEGFLIVFKERLFMYAGGYEIDNSRPVWEQDVREYVSSSEDGVNWTPYEEVCPRFHTRFWHLRVKDHTLYAPGYRIFRSGYHPNLWEVDLLKSDDGIHFQFVSELSRGGTGNETELLFEGEKLTAFIRNEGKKGETTIRVSEKVPYTEWSEPEGFGVDLQGITAEVINGRKFIFSRYLGSSPRTGSSFLNRAYTFFRSYVYVPEIESYVEYQNFPSGGDCGYPAAVPLDDKRMLVSYYSQHAYMDNPEFRDMEGGADIWLAVVRTDGVPDWGRLTPGAQNYLKKIGLL